jgi:AcrR family transcriptional regulator
MRPELREQQLLEAAERLFIEQGFAATSFDDIARAAGVTRSLIYSYFPSKEAAYLAVVQRARRNFEATMAAAVRAQEDPQVQFRAGTDRYFVLLEQDPRRWEMLFARIGLLSDSLANALTQERAATINASAKLFCAHLPWHERQEIVAFAAQVSGAAEQLGRWWLAHPEVTRDRILDLHTEFVWPAFQVLKAEDERRRSQFCDEDSLRADRS